MREPSPGRDSLRTASRALSDERLATSGSIPEPGLDVGPNRRRLASYSPRIVERRMLLEIDVNPAIHQRATAAAMTQRNVLSVMAARMTSKTMARRLNR